jgi:glutathione synthase/RimK-type ligase-like ATP-grasp enzyme
MSSPKKILILSNRINNVLYRNIQKHSVNEVYSSSYSLLRFDIKQGKVEIFDTANNLPLEQYNLVYFKQYTDETKACVIFLEAHNIPFLNKDLGDNFIFNKLAQYIQLGLNGFLIPHTVYGSHKGLKMQSEGLAYPFVLKSISSSLGQDNFLIQSFTELCTTLDENKNVPFVIQEFIQNNFDYRVLVLGDTVGTVLKRIRQNKDDHRNNTALGAIEEELATPDKAMVDLSISIAKSLNKDVAGVDLIFDELSHRYFIIEVNSKPSFTYDTNISSEVPAFTKFIDSVVSGL